MIKFPEPPWRISAVTLGDRRVLMRWKPGSPAEYQQVIGDAVVWMTMAGIGLSEVPR